MPETVTLSKGTAVEGKGFIVPEAATASTGDEFEKQGTAEFDADQEDVSEKHASFEVVADVDQRRLSIDCGPSYSSNTYVGAPVLNCPPGGKNAWLRMDKCRDAAPGELCEGDDNECGTNDGYNSCGGEYEVYWKKHIKRINGGLETCGYEDQNSCPAGYNIWVPATYDEAKYVREYFGADYTHLVGIFKTTGCSDTRGRECSCNIWGKKCDKCCDDGCKGGGQNYCQRNMEMNSDWADDRSSSNNRDLLWKSVSRTPDENDDGVGSPWFMRKDGYSKEPSGDYKANTWLDAQWHDGGWTDGEGFNFNDNDDSGSYCFTKYLCEACPAGRSKPAGSSGTNGYYCKLCAAGKYSGAGQGDCTSCEKGRYVGGYGNVECKGCVAGTSTTFNGDETRAARNTDSADKGRGATTSSQCVTCDPGWVSDEGSACFACPSGEESNGANTACVSCDPGRISSTEGSMCTPCDAGTVSNSAHTACEPCGPGTYSSAGASTCTQCGDGNWVLANWDPFQSGLTSKDDCKCARGRTGTSCDQEECAPTTPVVSLSFLVLEVQWPRHARPEWWQQNEAFSGISGALRSFDANSDNHLSVREAKAGIAAGGMAVPSEVSHIWSSDGVNKLNEDDVTITEMIQNELARLEDQGTKEYYEVPSGSGKIERMKATYPNNHDGDGWDNDACEEHITKPPELTWTVDRDDKVVYQQCVYLNGEALTGEEGLAPAISDGGGCNDDQSQCSYDFQLPNADGWPAGQRTIDVGECGGTTGGCDLGAVPTPVNYELSFTIAIDADEDFGVDWNELIHVTGPWALVEPLPLPERYPLLGFRSAAESGASCANPDGPCAKLYVAQSFRAPLHDKDFAAHKSVTSTKLFEAGKTYKIKVTNVGGGLNLYVDGEYDSHFLEPDNLLKRETYVPPSGFGDLRVGGSKDLHATISDTRFVDLDKLFRERSYKPQGDCEEPGTFTYDDHILRCIELPDGELVDVLEVKDGLETCHYAAPNSCPAGYDIWVPRSYDHALAVDTALSDSSLANLVGVYREEDGCGGCKNVAMNSGAYESSVTISALYSKTEGEASGSSSRFIYCEKPGNELTYIMSCGSHSPYRGASNGVKVLDDGAASERSCNVYNDNTGNSYTAAVRCVRFDRDPGWTKVTGDSAESGGTSVATCPDFKVVVGCSCFSEDQGCDRGSRPTDEQTCVAYARGGSVQAEAICIARPADWQLEPGPLSSARDDATSTATCDTGYIMTGCSCYSESNSYGCEGAYVYEDDVCRAWNQNTASQVKAYAICVKEPFLDLDAPWTSVAGSGEPWFMRKTKYSEPNGDYTAGCWLGYGGFDSQGFQFNDQDCNNCYKNYLCSRNGVVDLPISKQSYCVETKFCPLDSGTCGENTPGIMVTTRCTTGLQYDGTPMDVFPRMMGTQGVALSWLDTSTVATGYRVYKVADLAVPFAKDTSAQLLREFVMRRPDCGLRHAPLDFRDITTGDKPGIYVGYAVVPLDDEGVEDTEKVGESGFVVTWFGDVYVDVVAEGGGPVRDALVKLSHLVNNALDPAYTNFSEALTDAYGVAHLEVRIQDPTWFGLTQHFNVTVEKTSTTALGNEVVHEFKPPFEVTTVRHLGETSLSFVDETAISISGTVSHDGFGADWYTSQELCPHKKESTDECFCPV